MKKKTIIPPRVLTIAGSDSGGGAGIQADLKTFQTLGVFGTSAITAITAQNTRGVTGVFALSPDQVSAQITAVFPDLSPAAVKTGMLADAAIVLAVAEQIRRWKVKRLVVDPVMVSTSGDRLLEPEAVEAVRKKLLPLALVVTPNLDEAAVLAGGRVSSWPEMVAAAERISALGPPYVVVKGGHRRADADDLLFDGKTCARLPAPRRTGVRLHGAGCAFSAAVAAALARGDDPPTAVRRAKRFISRAIAGAFRPGAGAHTLRWGK